MSLSIVAKRLHFVTAFHLWDVLAGEMEMTDEVKAFTNRYKYLLNKYNLTEADDADIYEGDFSEWDEERMIAFDKELNLLEIKFERLLRTATPLYVEEKHYDPAIIANKFFKFVSVFEDSRPEINEFKTNYGINSYSNSEEYEEFFRTWDAEKFTSFSQQFESFIDNYINESNGLD